LILWSLAPRQYNILESDNVLCSVADPWHFGVDPDPDPVIFLIDLQDVNKKLICLLERFFAYYFLKVPLHHFSKIKSQKEVTKQ
jgi:hypothetical protein